jgi:hypothetical protein
LAQSDGHDAPRLIDQTVPGEAAVVEDVGVGFEDPVGQPVVAHELRNILDRVEFGTFGRQRQEGDIGRNDERAGAMPSGLIEQQHGVRARGDGDGDFRQMQVHRLGVASWQHERGAFAFGRTDGAKNPCRGSALILRSRGSGTAPCPTAGELGLPADPGFILPPQLYGRTARKARPDRRQLGGEVFLKAGIASASCAWWRGRADSLR